MVRAGNGWNRDGWAFGSTLPPGVRDVDCDRGAIPQEGESEERLWQIVGPREQERVSAEFAEQHLEFVRDAILDAQDSPRVAAPPGPAEVLLGRRLWREWIGFRDHALRELRQRGQLAGV